MKQIEELYHQWSHNAPVRVERLKGAGSNRSYYRIEDSKGSTVIGVTGTSREENTAFIELSHHFSSCGLNVPNVLQVSADGMSYLQTDLGSTSLFDALAAGRKAGGKYAEKEIRLLERTIRELPRLQLLGGRDLDFSICYPQAELDATGVMFDLNYFKYYFLKPSYVDFHELRLEEDFRRLTKDIVTGGANTPPTFLYRDFQARNVMLTADGTPFFIDFQGGRRGPIYYDLASFLWQASARYSNELRTHLVDVYYQAAQQLIEELPAIEGYWLPDRPEFDKQLRLFVFFRTLQVLGAYGFRGYFERKQHFIDSVPPALANLTSIIDCFEHDYPYLIDTLRRLIRRRPLVVRIYSFSYKRGIPHDESGNGGGYVFDCRSTHNPGRYEAYKHLTGLDEPVIRFLEDDGEITVFLDCVYRLADAHVARYIERGFTSLMFAFGCTGGQHRSVYSAEHLASHISEKFGVEVHICHREQAITRIIPATCGEE